MQGNAVRCKRVHGLPRTPNQTFHTMPEQITAAVAASRTVNAVCVDVENLGTTKTHYGLKDRVKFSFETDEKNDYGEPCFVSRVYNTSMHEWSSMRRDMESWNGKKLTEEEAQRFKAASKVGQQCQLKLVPHTSGERLYWNIDEIKPGKTRVETSGIYQRRSK